MARIAQRITRLEREQANLPAYSLNEEEKAFVHVCIDWINSNMQPDLSALSDWQRSMYAIALQMEERYR